MTSNRDRAFAQQKTFNIVNPISKATRDGMFTLSSTSIEKYKSNLYTLVFTGIGERPMMPFYGTIISQLIFEPLDESLLISIENEIIEKASYWIPEIVILKVDFKDKEEGIENNKINMKIHFSLVQDETIQDFIEVEMGI